MLKREFNPLGDADTAEFLQQAARDAAAHNPENEEEFVQKASKIGKPLGGTLVSAEDLTKGNPYVTAFTEKPDGPTS